MRTGIGKGQVPLWPDLECHPEAAVGGRRVSRRFAMLKDILSLIFLGLIISLAVSNGFNINKMERASRKIALKALSTARKTPLPSLKGIPSANPYGCGTYECHQKKSKRLGNSR